MPLDGAQDDDGEESDSDEPEAAAAAAEGATDSQALQTSDPQKSESVSEASHAFEQQLQLGEPGTGPASGQDNRQKVQFVLHRGTYCHGADSINQLNQCMFCVIMTHQGSQQTINDIDTR